ncbi:MAG: hypothetical protein ACRDJP_15405 [Actinomycetota bacterium]
MLRSVFLLLLGAVAVSLVLLGLGALARAAPGAPLVAIPFGVLIFLLGVRMLWRAGRPSPRFEGPPEEVGELDVFFVCTECGTEFRVEKLGELQVPRHCGEPMRVERRVRSAPELN